MKSKNATKKREEQGRLRTTNSNSKLKKLKCDYFIIKFFDYIPKIISLEVIKYNKSLQKRIDININHYKAYCEKYSSIELEIIPKKYSYGPFINFEEDGKEHYHIYFNDNKENEIKSNAINDNENISKISIIIDYQIESFSNLFNKSECIESINFNKFYRNNIADMSGMFCGCSSLKELNLNNFNTNNVTNMSGMFSECSKLKELNLNNFNTNNVTNMSCMFYGCSSLTGLNLNNFNTNNVTNMLAMFYGCSDELKLKIKSQFKIFKEEAFTSFIFI